MNENHKNHEILALDKGANKERSRFDQALKAAVGREGEAAHIIHRIKKYLVELEEAANKNRGDISLIYNEIRQKIVERESNLKRNISETLEKE